MILVTGGTGLVGAHLLFHLLGKGATIKAIHRRGSDLSQVEKIFSYYSENAKGLFKKIHWLEADLNDIPALETAFKDVTHVYHCAALISFDPRDYEKMLKINVEGTANIVNLCISNNIQKLCFLSSIAAVGKSMGNAVATEDNEWNYHGTNVYALTKHEAEMEVWRGSQEGLPVVILNPGVILGPGFWHTGSGVLFKTAAKGQKYYPPSGTGFVTVGDVVQLMVQLMASTIGRERFIAVGENLTYREILSMMAKGLGKPKPVRKLKFWQLEILWRLDWLVALFTNRGRKLTKNSVESLKQRQLYTNQKIKDMLNFKFEPLEEVIQASCRWFNQEKS